MGNLRYRTALAHRHPSLNKKKTCLFHLNRESSIWIYIYIYLYNICTLGSLSDDKRVIIIYRCSAGTVPIFVSHRIISLDARTKSYKIPNKLFNPRYVLYCIVKRDGEINICGVRENNLL